MNFEDSPNDFLSSEDTGEFANLRLAANQCARELAHQRLRCDMPDDPITPVTPLVPSTPMLAAHIYGGSSMIGDLELAANLGKALLLANRKLETEVKQNQAVIDDQSQEIAFLTKQTSALREANESRLKIYEQLEISIQELEKTNQRFKAEGLSDKKKIKVLLETVDQLELKCDQLHKDFQESVKHIRGRSRNKSHAKEDPYRRSLSCENSLQITGLSNEEDLHHRLEEMEIKLKDAEAQRLLEVKRREDFEIELTCVTQDNFLLREQLAIFKEREEVLKSIEEDFSSMADTSSGFCRKCSNLLETASNHTMQDMDDIEEDDIGNIRGPCSLFRLKNGGFAYGSQESLGSLGRMLNSEDSSPTSMVQTESQPNSLFSELNVEYWSAMNKCEKLIKQRETHSNHRSLDSGPNAEPCQRCPTCTCDSIQDNGPKSILEEFSEIESASSGFSETENKTSSKFTQTEEAIDDLTPTVLSKPIVNTASDSYSYGQGLPEYRKILHEVYYNIKQIVDTDKLSRFKHKTDECEDPTVEMSISRNVVESAETIQAEISAESDNIQVKPARPDFLEIESASTSKQKRRKRNKKLSIDTKQDEPIAKLIENKLNPSQVACSDILATNETRASALVESSDDLRPSKRDRSRRGCPHKIRNKNKARHQTNDRRQVAEAPCSETSKIPHPSVEVAKLRKLEMTYAQALKKSNENRRSVNKK